MKRKRWPGKRPFPWKTVWLWALALALVTFSAAGYGNLRGLIAVYGENRCRNLVTQILLDTAAAARTDEKLSAFTTIDEQSRLQLDSSAVLQYQAAVGKSLAERLDALGEQIHRVPLGTVLDSVIFMEQGPALAIRFIPVGAARVSIDSALAEAGVNQVLYRVTLDLSVDMTVVLPGGKREVSCTQQVVLEETLLTGQVPMVYGE